MAILLTAVKMNTDARRFIHTIRTRAPRKRRNNVESKALAYRDGVWKAFRRMALT